MCIVVVQNFKNYNSHKFGLKSFQGVILNKRQILYNKTRVLILARHLLITLCHPIPMDYAHLLSSHM